MSREQEAGKAWTDFFFKIFKSPGRLFIVILLLVGLGWGAKVLFMPVQTATDIMEKTLDADNVIYNYEWFKQTYEDVGALDLQIKTAQESQDSYVKICGDKATWGFAEKTEVARLNGVVLGLKNQRSAVVAEYNAKSKMANRSIFKSGDLPEQLQ